MSYKPYRRGSVPVWFICLLIVFAVSGIAAYLILPQVSGVTEELRILIRLYPYYVIAAAVFAWICYPERRLMAWILVSLILLSHIMLACLAFVVR